MGDELQSLWKTGSVDKETDLLKYVRNKSKSTTAKVLKTIRIEHYLNIAVLPLFSLYCWIDLGWFTGTLCSVLTITVLIYYTRLIKKVNQVQPSHDTRTYLNEFYALMRTFMRHYMYFLLFALFTGVGVGWTLDPDGAHERDVQWVQENLPRLSTSIILMISGMAVVLLFLVGMLYLLYGRHMRQLKKMIQSLEEDED